jgi:predicted neuraminidase
VVELGNGRLVMLNRADGTGCLWRSESADRGRTWTDPVPTAIPNPGSKFRLFRLKDGRIVLVHNPNAATSHPNSKYYALCNRNPLALWISDDDLVTWSYQRILTDFPGHLAYPDGVVDETETYVHLVFDYNRHDVIYWGAELPESSY